jgi:hypothetical protein
VKASSSGNSWRPSWDSVSDCKARTILFHITDEFHFIDQCMAELFKAIHPSLVPDDVKSMLDDAEATIAGLNKCQQSTRYSPTPVALSFTSTHLGELGLYIKAISQHTPSSLKACRVGDQRLGYLQDALEVPYWNMIADLFLSISTNTETGLREKIFEKAIAGCYQDTKQQLQRLEKLYASGEIDETAPDRIFAGIKRRLQVLEKFEAVVDPLRAMDAIVYADMRQRQTGITSSENGPTQEVYFPTSYVTVHTLTEFQEQVLLFSLLIGGIVAALIPGIIGFCKAYKDDKIGAVADSDFCVLFRDTVMAGLGTALSAVPLIKARRKNSAYVMALTFSIFVVLSCVAAIVLYPLANKVYSSFCGFIAQLFPLASFMVFALDRAPLKDEGAEGMKTSQQKKDQ